MKMNAHCESQLMSSRGTKIKLNTMYFIHPHNSEQTKLEKFNVQHGDLCFQKESPEFEKFKFEEAMKFGATPQMWKGTALYTPP